MTQDKTERHAMFASAILLVLFVGLTLFVSSIVRGASPVQTARPASATFRAKCAMCHGQDGSGSEAERA